MASTAGTGLDGFPCCKYMYFHVIVPNVIVPVLMVKRAFDCIYTQRVMSWALNMFTLALQHESCAAHQLQLSPSSHPVSRHAIFIRHDNDYSAWSSMESRATVTSPPESDTPTSRIASISQLVFREASILLHIDESYPSTPYPGGQRHGLS
ncbi:hypothetical protein P152DRAFT_193073 [Eremomyces bilateralis CBS 781.70]|uniref:Uncharacterized protein n=1 Tax=Eremomyces bilateralis CBS 781.70 TaxID=1392243 RepID=A0A6G1GCP8_9PEZI|nr:uncharacterized protein P152DRAFT_193073 [Eremomyces bilateralis CBS 781.70]KAF1815686.1 hypothetical protein P152DRAFT_193073 [Eremomyces bilateralis CBS 781.70]